MDFENFDINLFYNLTSNKKKEYIKKESEKISVPPNIDSGLINSYKLKEVINSFIVDYIEIKKYESQIAKNKKIKKIIKDFQDKFINSVLPNKLIEKYTNLYEMSDAKLFAVTNGITRSLSTRMGNLWEKIATISHLAICPDEEFKLKIKGIDLIFLKNKIPIYTQMKTTEGTLTGSQVKRSIIELSIHENSLFAACFATGTTWTFNAENINKISGKEFWNKIQLDYDFILNQSKEMIKNIQNEYIAASKDLKYYS